MTRRLAPLLLLLGACSGPTSRVEPGSIEARIVARALVEPSAGSASVTASRIGRITEVLVDVGDRVEEGQTLARLDARTLIEPSPIRAPIPGVVLARRADPGDDVSRADGALFEIADPSRVRLRFELEDEDADRVDVGLPLRVTARGGGPTIAEARVDRLSPQMTPRAIDAGGRAAERRLVRPGWGELRGAQDLPIGRELEVEIALPPREVEARVDRAAITLADGRPTLRVPGPLGEREVVVQLGAADAEHVEVRGVPAGTTVRLSP